jgi:hypothetical protein
MDVINSVEERRLNNSTISGEYILVTMNSTLF